MPRPRTKRRPGNYEKAVKLLERLEGRAAGSMLAQQAQIERAYYLWKSGEKAQALSTLERFIKLHPTSPALDYALYLQGLINFNDNLGLLGNLASQDLSERDQQAARDAYQSFRQLVEQFPQSTYAEDARTRMSYIVNTLAAYEVHVARYYLRRGAYVAAANRAQQAVQEFQRSPSTEEALIIMVQSYDRLGLDRAARRRRAGAEDQLPDGDDQRRRVRQEAQDALVEDLVTGVRRRASADGRRVGQVAQPGQRLGFALDPRSSAAGPRTGVARRPSSPSAGRRRRAGRDRFRCGSADRRPASAPPPPRPRSTRRTRCDPSLSSRLTRASTSGSFGGGNGSLSITTHCSASPGTSTPSQKLCDPTSTACGASRKRCISWRFEPCPCTSTSIASPSASKSARSCAADGVERAQGRRQHEGAAAEGARRSAPRALRPRGMTGVARLRERARHEDAGMAR